MSGDGLDGGEGEGRLEDGFYGGVGCKLYRGGG